ncbi:unnamed protein product [Vitrella brassicaformis CCMP3155]|uniref:Uncharacterized protein n=2 Tax=Vitrella brassicaformis TaxID=1169539 RepID=A0A0G4F2J5_VITBC|nr:unnamed protein product [Vitrella brassicaformis CCMP3155]|eukprot:CEM05769.1 unnamed protein product [Vitrella brassicaformis CCMP3155]
MQPKPDGRLRLRPVGQSNGVSVRRQSDSAWIGNHSPHLHGIAPPPSPPPQQQTGWLRGQSEPAYGVHQPTVGGNTAQHQISGAQLTTTGGEFGAAPSVSSSKGLFTSPHVCAEMFSGTTPTPCGPFRGAALVRGTSSDHGCFTKLPSSGVRYQIVQHGTGMQPTRQQTVKYDRIEWVDGFDGSKKTGNYLGRVCRVADLGYGWLPEALLSMRVGETRRLMTPRRYYAEVRLRAIL